MIYRLRKFTRRNRQALAAAIVAVLVAGGLALTAGLAVGPRVFRDASVVGSSERLGTLAVLPFQNAGRDDARLRSEALTCHQAFLAHRQSS